jgi:serine/threonine protein kinase
VARIQSKTKNVDIPAALRIFVHIARGVKHVHAQGLIHRDLKPSNCFMDDSELIKIGDFGLSRESGSNDDDIQNQGSEFILDNDVIETKQDITAGVGTTTYVSPEQKIGSDYDASTDVFSLGIILFELCYPMLTGMERMMVFSSIRKQKFPTDWNNTVAKQFPSIHKLIKDMLSHDPKSRPSSAEVTKKIELLLSEYTVLSLDQITRLDGSKESNIFLRVEAVYNDGILARTIKLIKDSSPHVIVSQYSLRGQETKAIMEFALSIKNSIDHSLDTKEIIRNVFVSLEEDEDITIVREVKRQDNVETHQST